MDWEAEARLAAPGTAFLANFEAGLARHRALDAAWVAYLRACGVKAAHPNDGWVDRARHTFHLVYPLFNDGVAVGDWVGLGHGWEPARHLIVRVTQIEPVGWRTAAPRYHYTDEWPFRPE